MNRVYVYRGGTTAIDLEMRTGQSVAGAYLASPFEGYDGKVLAGLLRDMGALQIAVRFPVLVSGKSVRRVNELLTKAAARSVYFDKAWILCRATQVESDVEQESKKQYVAFLTVAQVSEVEGVSSRAVVTLANKQIVTTVDKPSGSLVRADTMEMQPLEFADGSANSLALRSGEALFQILPSQPFADRFASPHSHYCVLHPSRLEQYRGGVAAVRNALLERAYPGFKATLPVVLAFDDRVPPERIVLDETTAVAVGARRGEAVALSSLSVARPGVWRRVLGLRHCLCRVTYAATLDMEKPVARVPEGVLDILGLSSGNKIVVESVSVDSDVPELRRATLRALKEHDGRSLIDSSVPDFLDVTGSVDLPIVALDFIARSSLGIVPGSAVYVRPALTGAIVSEYVTLSLVLLAGAVSSIFADHALLAGIMLLTYLVLVGTVLLQRLR